jgi:hypothetical protein
MPKSRCERPCHDCPFRGDIVPYQTAEDVADNLDAIGNPARRCVCHHAGSVPGLPRYGLPTGPTCAGFLVLRQRLGLAVSPRIKDDPRIFTLGGFALRAECPDQAWAARIVAWIANQPRPKQLREISRPELRAHLAGYDFSGLLDCLDPLQHRQAVLVLEALRDPPAALAGG